MFIFFAIVAPAPTMMPGNGKPSINVHWIDKKNKNKNNSDPLSYNTVGEF